MFYGDKNYKNYEPNQQTDQIGRIVWLFAHQFGIVSKGKQNFKYSITSHDIKMDVQCIRSSNISTFKKN